MDRGMNWVGLPLMMTGLFFAAQLISIVFYWMILKKAGYRGLWVWALALIVPGLSMIALAFLALAEWPIQREARELRTRTGISPPRPTP